MIYAAKLYLCVWQKTGETHNYRFDFIDEEGWPHFELVEPLPHLKAGEQSVLIKSAIVDYFLKQEVIS